MEDMLAHLETLQVQIAECEMIRDLATDPVKSRSTRAHSKRSGWILLGMDEVGVGSAGGGRGKAALIATGESFRRHPVVGGTFPQMRD